MIPNERPTPLTDAEASRIGGYSQPSDRLPADFARTLERSLAERTEERDKWANLAAQYSAEREHNANMALAYKADLDLMTQDRDSETRWAATYVKERDTGLAKLAKCREALEGMANMPNYDQDNEHRLRNIARQTLEETK